MGDSLPLHCPVTGPPCGRSSNSQVHAWWSTLTGVSLSPGDDAPASHGAALELVLMPPISENV